MARVEVKGGTQFSFNFDKAATVIVVPSVEKGRNKIDLPENAPQIINGENLRAAVQDYLERGSDEGERSGPWKKLEREIKSAREKDMDLFDLAADLELNLAEIASRAEGSKMGSVSQRFKEAKKLVYEVVEEVWTDPQ